MGQKRSVSARNGKNIHIWDHQYADGAPLGRGCGVLTRVPRGWEQEWPLSHKSSWVSHHKHFWADISFNFSAFGDVLKFNWIHRFEFNRPFGIGRPRCRGCCCCFFQPGIYLFPAVTAFCFGNFDGFVGRRVSPRLKIGACSFIALQTTYKAPRCHIKHCRYPASSTYWLYRAEKFGLKKFFK